MSVDEIGIDGLDLPCIGHIGDRSCRGGVLRDKGIDMNPGRVADMYTVAIRKECQGDGPADTCRAARDQYNRVATVVRDVRGVHRRTAATSLVLTWIRQRNNERESGDSDTIASITELEGGIQYNFDGGALSDAYIRLGLEGQYWVQDSVDTGLFGGILEFGIGF